MSSIKASELTTWTSLILQKAGVSSADSELAAKNLIQSDLRGIGTHGVARLGPYMAMLLAGHMNPRGQIQISDHGPLLKIDGNGALGQIAGPRALDALCKVAKTHGAAVGAIRNVGHLGALGVLLLPAAEQGLIAFIAQNGPPAMALPGSHQAAIGNNPLAFVAPAGEGEVPLVVDLATSAVAQGKIIEAARSGKPIPEGWAIGPDGQPTTDAAAALRGFLMPASEHKGIGLAFMVEVLAGALTGTRPVKSSTPSGPALPPAFGAFVLVLDPDALGSRDAFDAYLEESIAIYRKSGPDARYPGEGSAAIERERVENGIVLSDALVSDLQTLGEKHGIPFPHMSAV